jgi:hypothetical protein
VHRKITQPKPTVKKEVYIEILTLLLSGCKCTNNIGDRSLEQRELEEKRGFFYLKDLDKWQKKLNTFRLKSF